MKLEGYPEYRDSRVPWLGKIPVHWSEKRAKYYFKEVDERSQTGDEEMLSVSHITGVTPRSQKNVTMFKAETNVGQKLCQPGDLVINTMSGQSHQDALIFDTPNDCSTFTEIQSGSLLEQ
jgi:type I restriction enzyme S subunit